MFIVVLVVVAAILIAILWVAAVLVYVTLSTISKTLFPAIPRQSTKGRIGLTLSTIAVIVLALGGAWSFHVYQFHLGLVPDGIRVSGISYVKEENFGFGPGGNETGLLVFNLENQTVQEIQQQGMGYFAGLRNGYTADAWHQTPLRINNQWASGADSAKPPKIRDYLDKYGFILEFDPRILNEIDSALSSPGSYYVYGRGGLLIIVAPKFKKVYAPYAG